MFCQFKIHIWLIAIIAAFLAPLVELRDEPVAYAQGDDRDYVDVGVVLEVPFLLQANWNHELDIIVVNQGSRTAYDVEVVVDVMYPDNSHFLPPGYYSQGRSVRAPVGWISLDEDTSGRSLRWTIPELGGLQREVLTALVQHQEHRDWNNDEEPHEFFGKVTTASLESDHHKGNNTSRTWSYNLSDASDVFIQVAVDYTVGVSVDQPHPSPGDTVNFTVTAGRKQTHGSVGKPSFSPDTPPPIDLKVDIDLTDGLTDAGTPSYSEGNRFSLPSTSDSVIYSNGVFDIGTGKARENTDWHSVTLPIRVSNNAVVNEQCLTAKLTGNPPPGTGRLDDAISDNVAKVCLGEPTAEAVLFTRERTDLFAWYDCVGKTTYPCNNEDSLEFVVLNRLAGVASDATYELYKPEKVIVHVPDPSGRHTSLDPDSSALVWSTGYRGDRTIGDYGNFARAGVIIGFNGTFLAPGKWGVEPTGEIGERTGNLIVNVSGPGAASAWGIWVTSRRYETFPYLDETTNGEMYNDVWYFKTRDSAYAEFSALGTYKFTFSGTANLNKGTISDTSDDTAHTATATYTFHVGPIADLAVTAAPAAGVTTTKDQVAFTVTATNHGPDHAPDVRVPVTLPAGMNFVRADSEDYDPQTGVWDIGELKHKEYRRVGLRQSEGETLTVVAELNGDVTEPVKGSIKNHQDYCVRIKTGDKNPGSDLECVGALPAGYTEHSAPYYDHLPANNEFSLSPDWRAVAAKNPPYLTGLAITSTPTPNVDGAGDTYAVGDIIEVSATFSKDVHVTGAPALRLQVGDEEREAEFYDGSGTDTLRFHYTVGQWDSDDNGVSIPANPFVLRGNPIRDSNGNDAMLDFAGLGHQAGHRVGGPGAPQTRPEPQAIGRLTATPRDSAVDLEWPAAPDADKVFYQLWRNDDPTWWEISPRVVGSRLGYTVTGLENGTEYFFRVRAHYKYEHGDTPGPPSAPALATPIGPPTPEPGQTPTGPNTPPEFDRDTAWADYCVNAGAGSGTEVARVRADDQDGDRLQFFRRSGFDEIADNHFTVSTVKSGGAYWGVIRVSRTIPRDLEDREGFEGFIDIDLEVTDGRGGLDQIGVSLQYDPSSRNCQEATSRSAASGESESSVLATVSGWVSEVGAGIRSLFDAVARMHANLYRNLETAGAGLNPSPRSAAVWDW